MRVKFFRTYETILIDPSFPSRESKLSNDKLDNKILITVYILKLQCFVFFFMLF